MYAKCSGSPWLLQIPAEDDEGKGELRWELEIGRSLARCLFLTRKTSFAATLFPLFLQLFYYWPAVTGLSTIRVLFALTIVDLFLGRIGAYIEHLWTFVVAQGCILRNQGSAFCGIFLVALHERFSGHSVWTTLRRRTQSVRSARSHTFKWVYMCLLCV